MANGFVIAAAPDTSSNPTGYWDGTTFVPEIDSAIFFSDVEAGRAEAGRLQIIRTTEHVEAYPATLVVSHNPPLPVPTETGAEGV